MPGQNAPLGRLIGAATAVLAVATVTACGSPAAAPESAPAESGGSFPVTVTHAMGDSTVPEQPQRVIALDAGFVDGAIALQTEIIALPQYSGVGAELPEYLSEAGAGLADDATFLGTVDDINLEQLAAMEPDLIVSSASRHEEIYDELSGIAPTVMSETSPTWKDNLGLLAQALGKDDMAATLIADYEARAAAVGDAIRADGANPTMSVVRFIDEPVIRLYQTGSYSGEVLADAGIARPENQQDTEEAFIEISPELIPQVDADYVVLAQFVDEAGVSAQQQQQFQANPLWGQLQGELVEVDDTVWMGATGILGAEAILDDLAEIFGVDDAR